MRFNLLKTLVLAAFLSSSAWAQGRICPEPFSGPLVGEYEPKIIVLSAPSGGGKTTLANLLVKNFARLKTSVSTTTRAPRGAEKNGTDYHFVSAEDFRAKIAQNRFAEWAEVHGNYYGTDLGTIDAEFTKGHSVLTLLDIKGADILRKKFPGRVYTIFISPPDMATLEERLRGRGTDPEEAIRLRLENAKREMREASKFDRVIINDDLDRAYAELASLIDQERLVPLSP